MAGNIKLCITAGLNGELHIMSCEGDGMGKRVVWQPAHSLFLLRDPETLKLLPELEMGGMRFVLQQVRQEVWIANV